MTNKKIEWPHIITFDLETTNLKADFGRILSISWMDHHYMKKPKTIDQTQFKEFKKDIHSDKELVTEFYKVISKADGVFVWYGDLGEAPRLDLKFLQARMVKAGLPKLPDDIKRIDGHKVSRYNFALSSYRLDNVCDFFGLPGKTKCSRSVWLKAQAGDVKAIKQIAKYNTNDVLISDMVYAKLIPYIKNHPNMNLYLPDDVEEKVRVCKNCGSKKLQLRGTLRTKTNKYRRVSCSNCGTWDHLKKGEDL